MHSKRAKKSIVPKAGEKPVQEIIKKIPASKLWKIRYNRKKFDCIRKCMKNWMHPRMREKIECIRKCWNISNAPKMQKNEKRPKMWGKSSASKKQQKWNACKKRNKTIGVPLSQYHFGNKCDIKGTPTVWTCICDWFLEKSVF